jgi:hypothetical protein
MKENLRLYIQISL